MHYLPTPITIRIPLVFLILFILAVSGCLNDSLHVKSDAPLFSSPAAKTPSSETSSQTLPQASTRPKSGDEAETMPVAATRNQPASLPAITAVHAASPSAPHELTPPVSPKTEPKRSAQDLLDSALEFCNASNDYWERGDLENAVDALDEAYSLILQIDSEQAPEILQQRDDLRYTISQRILQVYSSRFTVVNGYHKAIPLDMNANVELALKLLKGRERKFFINAYRRSGRYRPAIVKALKEAGLPDELSWLPLIESGFKVNALSRARALGLWQFIASTGYKYGLKRDRWIDERMDPGKSTEAAIAYLKELHQIFGDWETVLAAYNCGEGRVLRCIKTQKINYLDHFWDLYEKLPTETAFYVPKFLAVLHILNDPAAHGFTLPPVDEPIEAETVTISRQLSLKSMAKHIDVSFEVLEELNPALRRNYTPPTPYAFNVPAGKGAVLLAELDKMPKWRAPAQTYVTHRVRRGETLSTIARRYGTSVRAIMNHNHLRSKNYIKAGWRLKIPARGSYAEVAGPAPQATAKRAAATPRKEYSPQKYVVRKGDSLWKIANRFNTTTKEIQAENKLRSTRLSIGQVLVMPRPEVEYARSHTKSYTVLRGDSPYLIAQKHQMDLADLLRINSLTPRSTIFPGQTLMVTIR